MKKFIKGELRESKKLLVVNLRMVKKKSIQVFIKCIKKLIYFLKV